MLTTQQSSLTEITERFLNGEVGSEALPEPVWGPIGKEVYERTYRRDGETWADTVKRNVLGNLAYAPGAEEPGEAVALFDLMYNFKAVPAGRHIWVTGTKASRFNRNCWVSGWSRRLSDHFAFAAARLFEGGGVGSNYSYDLRQVTQPVLNNLNVVFTINSGHPDYQSVKDACDDRFVEMNTVSVSTVGVEDTREGWIALWVMLIDAACDHLGDKDFVVDLSSLRPYGAELKTFGGRASGPGPLASSSLAIVDVLNKTPRGEQLTGLQSMEIDHYIAASVIAGGTRRAARMSLMNWRDPEIFDFMECKTNHSTHWSTNISVEIDDDFKAALAADDPEAVAVLKHIVRGMATNGEPGFIDSSLHSIGERAQIRMVNPCGEASLQAEFDEDGEAAGESCNLGSVNLEAFGLDVNGAKEAFRLMERFLYRATLHSHASDKASRIEQMNRRTGAGIFGLQGWAAAHGVRLSDLPRSTVLVKQLNEFREVARRAGNEIADSLGLPRPIKVTAVAPTGTIAQLAGTTPGVHAIFAGHFIRRVRYANSDPNLQTMIAAGYKTVPDVYAEQTTVVEFPVRDAILDRYDEDLIEDASEITLDKFVDLIAAVQNSFCSGSDGQAVSATASIPANMDLDELERSVRRAVGRVKGLTVFPELSRPLSPYERITKEEWFELTQDAVILESGDSNDGACIGGACPIR
ncbi:MAG: ribonucleoside-triphosphate reductase, adenosylcobalamin-dependent [Ferrimicrobium acidiphilum]